MYNNFAHTRIDKRLSTPLRLAIMASVAHSDEVDFMSLKQAVGTTDGNLSIQLRTLEEAGWLILNRITEGNRPLTVIALTNKGKLALDAHFALMREWIGTI